MSCQSIEHAHTKSRFRMRSQCIEHAHTKSRFRMCSQCTEHAHTKSRFKMCSQCLEKSRCCMIRWKYLKRPHSQFYVLIIMYHCLRVCLHVILRYHPHHCMSLNNNNCLSFLTIHALFSWSPHYVDFIHPVHMAVNWLLEFSLH